MKISKEQLLTIKNRLEHIEVLLNGGKGSGNWGHAGRPGERGGSAPKNFKSMVKIAKTNIDEASKNEPEVSRVLGDAFKKSGVEFAGFDYRIKTEKSLAGKISRDLKDEKLELTDENIQKVADAIHDNLRYTALCDKEKLETQYKAVVKNLKREGYELVKVKNTFPDTDADYRGLNTFVKNKDGYVFELQFHTPQSLDVKEKNHVDYDIARDVKTPKAEKQRLSKIMKARSRAIEIPNGAENIKNFNKLKG